jgi:hypothetical protein
MAEVTELVTKFSFVGNLAPLGNFNAGLGKGIGLVAGFTAAAAAASVAVLKWNSSILNTQAEIGNLSRETGIAAEQIQVFDFVASQTNSTADAMRGTLRSLSDTIGEAAQKGSEDFARLGISVRDANGQVKNASQVLNEVRGRFGQLNLSLNEQRTFASALGIDESLIQMLNKSDSEFAALTARAREFGVITGEQAEQAVMYSDAMKELDFAMNAIKNLMAVGLGPQLTRITKGFSDLIAENRDWIVDGLQAASKIALGFMQMLGRMTPVLLTVAGAFGVAKLAAGGFAAIMATILSPAVLIAGAIAAVVLVVDDLIVAFQGGDSVIANFFDSLLGKQGATKSFLESMVSGFKEIGKTVMDFNKFILNGIITVANLAISLANKLPFVNDIDKLDKFSFESFAFREGERAVRGLTGDGNRTVQQDVQVTVNSTDPERAGAAVADNLQRQLDNADAQLDRGGR